MASIISCCCTWKQTPPQEFLQKKEIAGLIVDIVVATLAIAVAGLALVQINGHANLGSLSNLAILGNKGAFITLGAGVCLIALNLVKFVIQQARYTRQLTKERAKTSAAIDELKAQLNAFNSNQKLKKQLLAKIERRDAKITKQKGIIARFQTQLKAALGTVDSTVVFTKSPTC